MASWALKDAAPEVVLEELHTASELMLMRLVGKRRAPAFAELVEHATTAGFLSRLVVLQEQRNDPEEVGDAVSVLVSLKDCRKAVKRQGADGAKVWLDRYFWAAGAVLEHMAIQLRGRPSTQRDRIWRATLRSGRASNNNDASRLDCLITHSLL